MAKRSYETTCFEDVQIQIDTYKTGVANPFRLRFSVDPPMSSLPTRESGAGWGVSNIMVKVNSKDRGLWERRYDGAWPGGAWPGKTGDPRRDW